jgi:hypothetical protein
MLLAIQVGEHDKAAEFGQASLPLGGSGLHAFLTLTLLRVMAES